MTNKRMGLFFFLATCYVAAAVAAYYGQWVYAQFALAMPWSVVVAMLSPLIIHTSPDSLDYLLLGCTGINLVLVSVRVFYLKLRAD